MANKFEKFPNDDLASLTKLDEQILVDQLRERYEDDRIYVRKRWLSVLLLLLLFCSTRRMAVCRTDLSVVQTYIGDILVAVNPFRPLTIYERPVCLVIICQ